MTTSQLTRRLDNLEGGHGENHDIAIHMPNPDEVIIYHMNGKKFLSQEILLEAEWQRRYGNPAEES